MAHYRNPTKRPITVVLSHPDAPRTTVAFVDAAHDPKTGEVLDQRFERRLPESVTVLGGETAELPDHAKKEALAQGLLRVDDPPAQKDKASPPRGEPRDALRELPADQPTPAPDEDRGARNRKGAR